MLHFGPATRRYVETAFYEPTRMLADTPRTDVRVLYISPLKALVYDVEKNLRGCF